MQTTFESYREKLQQMIAAQNAEVDRLVKADVEALSEVLDCACEDPDLTLREFLDLYAFVDRALIFSFD